jgi:deoxyribodipyrimidine photo-lyase
MPVTATPPVVWFKRDLRRQDHRPLAAAAEQGPVIPLLVIEPEYWAQPDTSHRHYVFMRDCAQALDEALTARGARLVVWTCPGFVPLL